MRRDHRALAGAAGVLALLLVAACGDGDGDDADADEDGAGTPAAAEAGAEGAATDDRRIVVLAEEFVLADVLELGIRPVASTASVPEVGFQGLDAYDTEGIEVLPMTTLSLEYLASLRPDVIITLQFWADQVGEDALRGMGELLLVPDGLPVPERLAALGELLDRRDEAEAVVAELEAATDEAAAAVPENCTVSLAAVYPGPSPAVFVDGPWDLPTAVLSTGCALDPDASVVTPDENGRVYLSMEQVTLLDAPTLVLLQSETVEGEQQALDEITADPLWSRLPAVEDDNVVVFDRLGYPGATGQIRFLEDFTAALQP